MTRNVEVVGGPHDGRVIPVQNGASSLSILENVAPVEVDVDIRPAFYPIRPTPFGLRVFWRERRIW